MVRTVRSTRAQMPITRANIASSAITGANTVVTVTGAVDRFAWMPPVRTPRASIDSPPPRTQAISAIAPYLSR